VVTRRGRRGNGDFSLSTEARCPWRPEPVATGGYVAAQEPRTSAFLHTVLPLCSIRLRSSASEHAVKFDPSPSPRARRRLWARGSAAQRMYFVNQPRPAKPTPGLASAAP